MVKLIQLYGFVASIWFYLEWKETKNVIQSLIIGTFWVYEVFYLINKKLNS